MSHTPPSDKQPTNQDGNLSPNVRKSENQNFEDLRQPTKRIGEAEFKEWLDDILGKSAVSEKKNGKWVFADFAVLEIAWNLQQQVWKLEERLTNQEERKNNAEPRT